MVDVNEWLSVWRGGQFRATRCVCARQYARGSAAEADVAVESGLLFADDQCGLPNLPCLPQDFVYFILSEEDKSTDASLDYWFRCAQVCVELAFFVRVRSGSNSNVIRGTSPGLLVPVRPACLLGICCSQTLLLRGSSLGCLLGNQPWTGSGAFTWLEYVSCCLS